MRQACRGDQYCEGVATFYLGRTYLELSQYDRALDFLQGAEEAFGKLGKTNEAVLQYERIVREFADEATLATLKNKHWEHTIGVTEEGFKALAEIKKIHDIMWQAFSVPVSEES